MQHLNTAKKIGGRGRNPLIKTNFSFFKKKSSQTSSRPGYQELISKPGFTLVELVIVISILTILSIIAFISFARFSKDARDANRIATLKNIEDGLQLYATRNATFPTPDGSIEITASGEILSYQGILGENVSKSIGLNKLSKDPKDGESYLYSVSKDKGEYSIFGNLEKENENFFFYVDKVYASNFKNRYTIKLGDNIGYILNENGDLLSGNIETSSGNINYTILFGGNDIITASGNLVFSNIYTRNKDVFLNKSLVKLDNSLLGYWDMETIDMAGKLKDFSQYGHNGICRTGTSDISCNEKLSKILNGKTGKAMTFNGLGVPDTDAIRTNIPLRTLYNFSINILVKKETNRNNNNIHALIGGIYGNNCIYCVSEDKNGTLFVHDFNGVAEGNYLSQVNGMPTGMYTFISLTRNGDFFQLYINGKKTQEGLIPQNTSSVPGELFIGGLFNNTYDRGSNSTFDEVFIYDRILSDQEILQQAKIAGF